MPSSIEWTMESWNPLTGCTRVSAGCDHCYAFALHDKRHAAIVKAEREGRKRPKLPRQYDKPFSEVQLLPNRLHDPLRWRKPRRVFVNSMGDLFHEDVPDLYLDQIYDVMEEADRHTFQILTKRPERMLIYLAVRYGNEGAPHHIWHGTSVESRDVKHRIWTLKHIKGVTFLSVEPLIEDLGLYHSHLVKGAYQSSINWVIVGGESGPRARPMDPEWARAIRDQCKASGVAFFVKQMAKKAPIPDDLMVREYPA